MPLCSLEGMNLDNPLDPHRIAYHEAGHAYGYWMFSLPLRYITLRPRGAKRRGFTDVGACRVWKPRRIETMAAQEIAALGPLAEAILAENHRNRDDGYEFCDHVFAAVMVGGHDDLRKAGPWLDPPLSGFLEQMLRGGWPGLERLAETILAEKTVTGSAAFRLLDETLGLSGISW